MSGSLESRRGLAKEIPPGYVAVRSPAAEWVVRPGFEAPIERGELDFLLHGRVGGKVQPGSGRGPVVHLMLADQAAVGKQALHGGFLGPMLGRLYLGSRRGLDQVTAAVRLRKEGVPTPDVLALGVSRVFGPVRKLAIVTRELRGGKNLLELSTGELSSARRRDLLTKCAELIRRMHDAGFQHADLNLSNLVLVPEAVGDPLYIVDLDGGRFWPVVPFEQRFRNLARLLRSYEKWLAGRLRLSGREEILFLRHYVGRDHERVRSLATGLARYRAGLRLRRFGWRLKRVSGSKDRIARTLQ